MMKRLQNAFVPNTKTVGPTGDCTPMSANLSWGFQLGKTCQTLFLVEGNIAEVHLSRKRTSARCSAPISLQKQLAIAKGASEIADTC